MQEGVFIGISELIALKRYLTRQQNKSRLLKAWQQGGNLISPNKGRGMDLADIRDYQAGDEVRHMQWRATARTGKPHIKVYQEEKERPVCIVTDLSSSMFYGTKIAFKSVVASKLAAMLTWFGLLQNDRIGGLVFNENTCKEIKPKHHQHSALKYIGLLDHFQKIGLQKIQSDKEVSKLSFTDMFEYLRVICKPGTKIIFLSDTFSLSQKDSKHLHNLQKNNEIFFFHIADPIELSPPAPGEYPLYCQDQYLFVNTNKKSVQRRYQDACNNRLAAIKKLMNNSKIGYYLVTAETDLAKCISVSYAKRGFYA